MLGKLIKHEWKRTWKMGIMFLLVIFLVTVLGCLSFQLPFVSEMFRDQYISEQNQMRAAFGVFIWMISVFVYIIMLVGVFFGIIIYMGVHFYQTMYAEEGYLTHTLPVTPHQLLCSKTLISATWMIVIQLAAIVSVVLLILSMATGIISGTSMEQVSMAELWSGFLKAISYVMEELDVSTFRYWTICVLTFLVAPVTTILMIYAALTLGQLFRKHKLMMGIVCYIGLSVMRSVISSVVGFIVSATGTTMLRESIEAENVMLFMSLESSLLLTVVFGVLFYMMSRCIINRKLNLQ